VGIGFAIPVNMAKEVSDQLIHQGSVTRGYLGVMIQALTPELAKSFGLDSDAGVLVGDVMNDSPAAKAGLQAGDVIRKFDGDVVKDVVSFRNRVARVAPNSKIELTVVRDGKELTLTVHIGQLQGDENVVGSTTEGTNEQLGMALSPLTNELRQRFGYDDQQGVVVVEVTPGSKAAEAGMQPGMLIKEVNRHAVNSPQDVRQQLESAGDADTALLLVEQDGHSRFVALPLNG
jgi:serine protease Do